MGGMKLTSIAFAALLIGSASASAITVKKRAEAPGLPSEIWTIVGDFCAIKAWHPAVEDCVKTKEGDVVFRTLTLKGGGTIKEKLTGTEENGYSYEIIESPLPVKNYKARLWLEVDDEPHRAVISWQSDFDANGASDDDAKKTIGDVFAAGVEGIKQQAATALNAREAADGKTSTPKIDEK